MEGPVSISLGKDKCSSVAKVKEHILDISADDLIWMQEGRCLADNNNFSAVWIDGDGTREIILLRAIETPMSGKAISAVA